MPEGRESPSPERQSGRQIHETPGSGQGTDNAENKEQINKDQLESLKSNPKDVMEDELKQKFAKSEK
ncbi:Fc.00g042900.m01.CDS01 [Cosmosporella sp. VM-42]